MRAPIMLHCCVFVQGNGTLDYLCMCAQIIQALLVLALSMLQPYFCADMWCALYCCVFVQVWCDQLPGNLDLHRMMVIPQAGEVRGKRGVAGMESGLRVKHVG